MIVGAVVAVGACVGADVGVSVGAAVGIDVGKAVTGILVVEGIVVVVLAGSGSVVHATMAMKQATAAAATR